MRASVLRIVSESIRRGIRRARQSRRGTAVVEMAVVTPLLLTLAIASADFGRVINAYITVANAARSGAECGAMHGFMPYSQSTWQARIQTAVSNEFQGVAGFNAAKLSVATSTTTDSDGLFRVTVGVTYPFDTIVQWPGLPSHVDVYHAVEMREIR